MTLRTVSLFGSLTVLCLGLSCVPMPEDDPPMGVLSLGSACSSSRACSNGSSVGPGLCADTVYGQLCVRRCDGCGCPYDFVCEQTSAGGLCIPSWIAEGQPIECFVGQAQSADGSEGCQSDSCPEGFRCDPSPNGDLYCVPSTSPGAGESPQTSGANEGGLSCSEFFDCFGRCPDTDEGKDPVCTRACLEDTQPDAVTRVLALNACVENSGCPTTECAMASCEQELDACFGPPGEPTGTMNCTDILACYGDEERDPDLCMTDAAPQSWTLFESLLTCSEDYRCSGVPDCLGLNCSDELSACRADGRTFGESNCSETWNCAGDCPPGDSESCIDECLEDASLDARTNLRAMVDCLYEQGCPDTDCPGCSEELAACGL